MNWSRLKEYYKRLITEDVYPQPIDQGHLDFSSQFINWIDGYLETGKTVLDLGCGQAILKKFFVSRGIKWHGTTVGEDYDVLIKNGEVEVWNFDYNVIPVQDCSMDYLVSRHSLEHSPFPLLTLMEWHRICKEEGILFLVLPAPEYWGYGGRNHYSVLNRQQWEFLFRRSGWLVEDTENFLTDNPSFFKHFHPMADNDFRNKEIGGVRPVEYWYVLRKGEEINI